MSVKIRLKRVGARNHPVFRIIVADSRTRRDGSAIEELGTYHPQKKGDNYTIDIERANYWLSQGAQASDTVSSFLKRAEKAKASGGVTAAESEPAAAAAPASAPETAEEKPAAAPPPPASEPTSAPASAES